MLLTSSLYAGNPAVAENRRREKTEVERALAEVNREIAETLGHPALLRP